MSITTSIEVIGLDDMNQQLRRLVTDAVAARQISAALSYASNPMLKSIRTRAPKAEAEYYRYYRGSYKQRKKGNANPSRKLIQPGTLRKSIARKRVRLERSVGIGIYVKSQAFYWRFIERGTPRMAANPFLRNSFDEDAPEAINRFKQKFRENIDKIIARQALAAAESGGE